jgi:hypothetical protein
VATQATTQSWSAVTSGFSGGSNYQVDDFSRPEWNSWRQAFSEPLLVVAEGEAMGEVDG